MSNLINTSLSQPWFVHLSWDNTGTLLVMNGTLEEVLFNLRRLSNETCCVAKVFHPTPGEILESDSWIWRTIKQMKLVPLREVAHVFCNTNFELLRRGIMKSAQELSLEQKEAELNLLQTRIQKEIDALQVQKEVNQISQPQVPLTRDTTAT